METHGGQIGSLVGGDLEAEKEKLTKRGGGVLSRPDRSRESRICGG